MHAWPQVVSNRRGLKASLYKVSSLNIVFYKKIIVAAFRNSNARDCWSYDCYLHHLLLVYKENCSK